jgi:hypothetical protein
MPVGGGRDDDAGAWQLAGTNMTVSGGCGQCPRPWQPYPSWRPWWSVSQSRAGTARLRQRQLSLRRCPPSSPGRRRGPVTSTGSAPGSPRCTCPRSRRRAPLCTSTCTWTCSWTGAGSSCRPGSGSPTPSSRRCTRTTRPASFTSSRRRSGGLRSARSLASGASASAPASSAATATAPDGCCASTWTGGARPAIPRGIALAPHQEIVLAFDARNQLPKPVPDSFEFAPGL